jgi:hypothetical protein
MPVVHIHHHGFSELSFTHCCLATLASWSFLDMSDTLLPTAFNLASGSFWNTLPSEICLTSSPQVFVHTSLT